jgi:hypothetical protein
MSECLCPPRGSMDVWGGGIFRTTPAAAVTMMHVPPRMRGSRASSLLRRGAARQRQDTCPNWFIPCLSVNSESTCDSVACSIMHGDWDDKVVFFDDMYGLKGGWVRSFSLVFP